MLQIEFTRNRRVSRPLRSISLHLPLFKNKDIEIQNHPDVLFGTIDRIVSDRE